MRQESLTGRVIKCFFTAYNEVGFGLPEHVYAGALEVLFREAGIQARREHLIEVVFRDTRVGRFRLDYLVEESLVLELKAGHVLPLGSRAQLLTYLRTTRLDLGLLLFFGPVPDVIRVAL